MKISMITLSIVGLFSACSDDKPRACIDESKIKRTPCYEIYDPVCGCDGKTYSNDCYAENAGVTRYTKGPCRKAN